MKVAHLLLTASTVLLTQCGEKENGTVNSPPAEEWTNLFDGTTTDGWKNPYDWGKIEVVDGELHLTGDKKFFLVTEETYSDFVFEGEVLLPQGPSKQRLHVPCPRSTQ